MIKCETHDKKRQTMSDESNIKTRLAEWAKLALTLGKLAVRGVGLLAIIAFTAVLAIAAVVAVLLPFVIIVIIALILLF
jgi:hypothetical protein